MVMRRWEVVALLVSTLVVASSVEPKQAARADSAACFVKSLLPPKTLEKATPRCARWDVRPKAHRQNAFRLHMNKDDFHDHPSHGSPSGQRLSPELSSLKQSLTAWKNFIVPLVCFVFTFSFHLLGAEPWLEPSSTSVASVATRIQVNKQEAKADQDLLSSVDTQYDRLMGKLRETPKMENNEDRGSISECITSGKSCTPGYGTKRTPETIRRDVNKNLLLEAWDTIHRGGYGYPGWFDPNGGLFVSPDSFMGSERADWVSDPALLSSRPRTLDAIRRMVEDLHDPYSRFLSKEEAALENRVPSALAAAGRTVGVGLALFDPVDGKEDLVVVAPVPESPAELAGIKPLDRVVEVDGLDASAVHLTPDEGMSLLRGPKDSEVSLRVQGARNAVGAVEEAKDSLADRLPLQLAAWAEPEQTQGDRLGSGLEEAVQTVKLKRQSLTIPPVRAGIAESPILADSEIEGMINGGKRALKYGYVRINFFNRLGTDMLASALLEMQRQEVDGVIVDVRNCLGGLFKEALYAASMLLGEDECTLVRVMDSSGEVKRMTVSGQRDIERWPKSDGFPLAEPLSLLKTKPLRVITNRGSASSSEVLAMAVVGNGRGALIGERTFGKALIQHPYTLSDGSVIKLTVAEYFSPRGQHLGRGLEPEELCPASPAPNAADRCVRTAQLGMARQGRSNALRFSMEVSPQQQAAASLPSKKGGGSGSALWWLWERSSAYATTSSERFQVIDLSAPARDRRDATR